MATWPRNPCRTRPHDPILTQSTLVRGYMPLTLCAQQQGRRVFFFHGRGEAAGTASRPGPACRHAPVRAVPVRARPSRRAHAGPPLSLVRARAPSRCFLDCTDRDRPTTARRRRKVASSFVAGKPFLLRWDPCKSCGIFLAMLGGTVDCSPALFGGQALT